MRADNADQRLTRLGVEIGCVGKTRQKLFDKKISDIKNGFKLVKDIKFSPNQLQKKNIKIKLDGKKRSVFELLSHKNISFQKLEKILPELKNLDLNTKEQIQIESIYFGSLSNEIIEKLTKIKPPNLGAASRISGVTPAAIIAIMRYIKKNKNKKAA